LLAVFDPSAIKRATDYVIADARKVLDAASAHEHNGVLLEIVPDARNVRRNLYSICEANARDLAKS
jgi:hypothetical protein